MGSLRRPHADCAGCKARTLNTTTDYRITMLVDECKTMHKDNAQGSDTNACNHSYMFTET